MTGLNMTESRKFDTLTPEFRIAINRADLPLEAKADLVSVTIVDDVTAAGMFSFTLQCWDGSKMEVKWIDDDLFKEGNSVTINMGYIDKMKTLFEGEITGLEPEFLQGESATLTVRGYDRRHRLMRKRKTRTFLKMKDSDIAKQIAGDWGLRPEVDDTRVTLDYVLQNNATDYVFLVERARRIGYEAIVTAKTLHFRPRQNNGNAALTLKREVDLLDFNIRFSSIDQVEEVLVQGWNPGKKEEFVARSSTGEEQAMGGTASGPAAVKKDFGSTGDASVRLPVQSQEEADQLAKSWLLASAMRYVEGHGVCIGRPDLRAGILVNVEGLGRRVSGSYYVTCAEHSYRPSVGYRTAFTVMRNAT